MVDPALATSALLAANSNLPFQTLLPNQLILLASTTPSFLQSPTTPNSTTTLASAFQSKCQSPPAGLLLPAAAHSPQGSCSSLAQRVRPLLNTLLQGFQAVPVRLKILLDRVLEHLPSHEVECMLASCGWTLADYKRGYLANASLWQCAPQHLELQLLHSAALLLPEFAALAQSLRQSALHSLLALALAGGEQQPPRETEIQQMGSLAGREELPVEEVPPATESMVATVPMMMEEQDGGEDHPASNDDDGKPLESTGEVPGGNMQMEMGQSTTPTGQMQTTGEEPSEQPMGEDGQMETASVDGFCGEEKITGRMKPGKRRVQCPICMKTYCDKGALKIHNSAVHLKETHFCTVQGCDRAFSSRRSRNRHSLNVNMHATLLGGKMRHESGEHQSHEFSKQKKRKMASVSVEKEMQKTEQNALEVKLELMEEMGKSKATLDVPPSLQGVFHPIFHLLAASKPTFGASLAADEPEKIGIQTN